MKHLMHQNIFFFPVPQFLLTYLYYYTIKRWTIFGHKRCIEKEKFLNRNNHYYFISLWPCRSPKSQTKVNMLPRYGRGGATFWVWHRKEDPEPNPWSVWTTFDFELLVTFLKREQGMSNCSFCTWHISTENTASLVFNSTFATEVNWVPFYLIGHRQFISPGRILKSQESICRS